MLFCFFFFFVAVVCLFGWDVELVVFLVFCLLVVLPRGWLYFGTVGPDLLSTFANKRKSPAKRGAC